MIHGFESREVVSCWNLPAIEWRWVSNSQMYLNVGVGRCSKVTARKHLERLRGGNPQNYVGKCVPHMGTAKYT